MIYLDPISKMDVAVNGNTVGDVDELIVSRDETTTVNCESDGYEIGAGEPQGMFISLSKDKSWMSHNVWLIKYCS